MNTMGDIFKNILALLSFIIVVNGGHDFEAPPQKMHPSITKIIHTTPGG